MQIKIFTLPVVRGELEQEEMNKFLRGNRVVSIDKHFCQTEGMVCWTFCVLVAEGNLPVTPYTVERKEKVDYKEVLDEKSFAVFTELRMIRKQLANEDAVPAYAVFTPLLAFVKHAYTKGYRKRLMDKYRSKPEGL